MLSIAYYPTTHNLSRRYLKQDLHSRGSKSKVTQSLSTARFTVCSDASNKQIAHIGRMLFGYLQHIEKR